MTMTSAAKGKLSKTIRALRERLLTDLSEATDREYKLSIRTPKLDTAKTARRKRLEDWLAEQARAETGKQKRTRDDFRREAEQQAAYTLLNRLVILRVMEATGLRKPKVVTGGWNSQGYKDFRELAPALIRDDESEGYSFLLQLIFEDLATDLPGLYGSVGVADLIPVPSATIRAVVEAFDDSELESCWTDDMTLGWVYQYWNDPQREALDKKINEGGKIEPHEIASKTQMFTERYMVDWLLQNSLGPMWLAMCKKHGWTPEVEADGTLQRLEDRRVAWRAKRDAGEVELTDLMPLETDAEKRWAYYVPQPIPDDAMEHAPDSVRDLKILDPAVGSGHFLVVAFDLLVALYKEEARHRAAASLLPRDGGEGARRADEGAVESGSVAENPPHPSPLPRSDIEPANESTLRGRADKTIASVPFNPADWSDVGIVERILEHNLHGIDLDSRAVQIAAAALWLKAQQACPAAHPRQLNLVASNLGIASLPDNDPALVELRAVVEKETGIPAKLTNQIVEALRGADHLGSLLKVDAAIETAISQYEEQIGWKKKVRQIDMFPDGTTESRPRPISRDWAQNSLLAALELFLSQHTSAKELGLRLRGEQLAAGVRFVRLVREGTYDVVVANPPYQGTSKMADAKYVATHYKLAKADLFAAFLLRGLELVREHGVSAMLTMRNWMFITQYSDLRQHLLQTYDLRALGDLSSGAFQEINAAQVVVSVAMACFWRDQNTGGEKVAIRPFNDETLLKPGETERKRAATLCHVGRHTFDPAALKVVPEWPLVYWWDDAFLKKYATAPKLGEAFKVKQGMATANNTRFLRYWWEVAHTDICIDQFSDNTFRCNETVWAPYVKGAEGLTWLEPLNEIVRWKNRSLESHEIPSSTAGKNDGFYFRRGIAFTSTGSEISARAHRFRSVFDVKGQSFFPSDIAEPLCNFNSAQSAQILADLNPTISFQVGDAKRLPIFASPDASRIVDHIEVVFSSHESHREPSVEFIQPGPSPWRHAQEWAQLAVDRSEGAPLPEYVEELDLEPPTDHLSFAVGVSLGRFGANGEGILDPTQVDLSHTLPHGILFLDGALGDDDRRDSLGHEAAQIVHDKWTEYGSQIDTRRSLRDWLREKFFSDVHRQMYENRPIHWPLSSAKKTFVAFVTIHHWNDQTLRVLLADHLEPALKRLDGEIADLTDARGTVDKKQARAAEQRFDDVKAWRDELVEFIANVQQCAERGPAPADSKKPEREVDARYIPDLDDGVMVNSAALWPLLEPQWKDPKKWWKELVAAKGKKDYDWSHLAMRYWPTRVDQKCETDPSLGVAHGCFWKYHPARAWAWELRLQDEIGPDFRIIESPYRGDRGGPEHRTAFLRDHTAEALETIEKEVLRRKRKQKKPQPQLTLLESGMWSAVPAECWDLEIELTDKQQVEFRLLAPDESKARRTFEEANPDKVKSRKALISRLRPPDLYADEEADDETEENVDTEEDPEAEEVDA
jgi:hypothetical protein